MSDFNPEKVERVNVDNEDRHDIVLASDYDQLLELYRKVSRDWSQRLEKRAVFEGHDPQTP